jgi:hypothetical protein
MIALELYINGKKTVIAGVERGVMSAITNWVGLCKDGNSWHSSVSVAGLDDKTSEHLKWFRHDLAIGDEVRIRLVETDKTDLPVEREAKE